MAQLTLSERSEMANSTSLQNRMRIALKKTANYWINYSGEDNNTAVFKRKNFARSIQGGGMPNMQAYSEYFMSMYNEDVDTPDANGDPRVVDGVLADHELAESPTTPVAFDFFAGVEQKDI